MTAPRRPLRIESLEDRTVPTALGSAWPNPGTLTLSFAADGTPVGDTTSNLSATLGNLPAAAWQREILRAFQTWAVQTNANIALVADGGQAFGTPGEAQGDFRFGDIRIGSYPLSADALANASGFDLGIGTWAGDVLLNSRSRFAINPSSPTAGADLFTALLHEAGHVFGLEHSDNPSSAMGESYTGTRSGLSASDIALVRSYYGARQPDQYEGTRGNDTFATATPVDTITGLAKLTADVQSNGDVDTYSLLNTSVLGTLTVRVKTSGISLLTPKVSVYDSWGRLVASATAAGPGQDVELNLPRSLLNLTYSVKVTGATNDVFGIGGYELSVARTDGLGQLVPGLLRETGLDNTLSGAVELLSADSDHYSADAALDSKTDTDFYTFTAPQNTDAKAKALAVTVRNTSGNAHPALAVYNAAGQAVPFQMLNNNGGTLTIQVLKVHRGETYFVRVGNPADGSNALGRYHLTADFQAPVEIEYERVAAGRLGAGTNATSGTMTVSSARLFEFALSSAAQGVASGQLTLTVRDAAGKVVFTLSQAAGSGMTNGAVYLTPGTYTVEIGLTGSDGQPAAVTDYRLGVRVVSDPVGPYDAGSAGTYPGSDPGSDPEPMTYSDDSSSYAYAPAPGGPGPASSGSYSSEASMSPPMWGGMAYYSF